VRGGRAKFKGAANAATFLCLDSISKYVVANA